MFVLFLRILRFLTSWRIEVNVIGKENIPEKGPVIICFNHVDYLDPAYVLFALMKNAWAMVADKHRKNPIVWLFVKTGRAILVDRRTNDQEALTKAKNILDSGKFLGVSPEGTRSHNGILQKGKFGAAYLAGLTDSQILPLGIKGSIEATKNILHKKIEVTVTIGKPFELQDIDALKEKTEKVHKTGDIRENMIVLREWRDITNTQIMPKIAELLPENQRGEFG